MNAGGKKSSTGTTCIHRRTQRRGFSRDPRERPIGDTTIFAALRWVAQNLDLGVLLEDLFEFDGARTVEISALAHTIARVPVSSSAQIPEERICSFI